VSDILIRLEMTGDTTRKIVVHYPETLAGVFEGL
jgi:hypothetical protein